MGPDGTGRDVGDGHGPEFASLWPARDGKEAERRALRAASARQGWPDD